MTLQRRSDWPERLVAVLSAARRKPFVWGEHDCWLFAATAIEAMTGVDLAAKDRGTYSTRTGATRALKRVLAGHGTKGGVEALPAVYGLAETTRGHAKRGDLALVPTPIGPAFGIVSGVDVACAGQDGLVRVPIAEATHVWSVA